MVSLICPVYNEEKYIRHVLDFYMQLPQPGKEIIFADGNSSDATAKIIDEYAQRCSGIKLLHNPHRYVSYALNHAIKECSHSIIIRIDAHTEYSSDYVEKVAAVFDESQADIVGGPMRIAAGNKVQQAIGYATSTFFGVGNSSFHFENFEGYTDSVYLGAWKKYVFEKTGMFDESLIRNQDDEFHYRAKSLGFKIYQSPKIKLYYHPRSSFASLFKQYYQYGLYKPRVLRKIPTAFQLRHLFPSLFVIYLFFVPLIIFKQWYWMLLPLAVYAVCNLFFSMLSKQSLLQLLRIMLAYFIIHAAYGAGFIAGTAQLLFKRNGKR